MVLFRQVNSMTEFKQIVGRGTRVREDKGKLFFRLIDYAGSANRQFADPDFDGEPPLITSEEINEDGETVEGTFTTEEIHEEEFENKYETDDDDFSSFVEEPSAQYGTQKYYVEEGEVTIIAETVQILDANGNLITVQFTQYTKDRITTMFTDAEEFKKAWSDPYARKDIIEQLENSGISLNQLEEITQIKEADYFDLLCHVAFGMRPITRKQRAERVKKAEKLQTYSEKDREIIQLILEKYIEFGAEELSPNIIKVHPISQKGNVMEIVNEFGGIDEFKKVLTEIQQLLYAA